MRLEDLPWVPGPVGAGCKRRADVPPYFTIVQQAHNGLYTVITADRGVYPRVDAIMAQAVIYHLLNSEENSDDFTGS